jgi:hypothetical protein
MHSNDSNDTVLRTGETVDGSVLYTTFQMLLRVSREFPHVIYDVEKYAAGNINAMQFLQLHSDEEGASLKLDGRSLFNTILVNVTIYRASIKEGKLVNPISDSNVQPEAVDLRTSFNVMLKNLL